MKYEEPTLHVGSSYFCVIFYSLKVDLYQTQPDINPKLIFLPIV